MTDTNIGKLYLQSALYNWRKANPWADEIPFEAFPQRYRDAIEVAAHINLEVGR